MKLHLAEGLSLPVDFATQTLLIVGKRGSGKSNTAVVLAEELSHALIPWVAIDPVDNWHGLRSSADGTKPGLPVTIFGGSHADVPLEPTGGALVADVVVDSRTPAILSIRHFSNRDKARFVADFFERLYKTNKEPLHVFLEEAHEVAPQSPFKGEEEMLGRVTRLWKLGRSSGLGGSAITQRPASLNKNITTQAEILIVHRTIGPQDVAAVKEWIKYHGESDAILSQLATLKTGEAFLWAPDFPDGDPIGLKKIQVRRRSTFDSAATPKAGHVRREPKVLATPDLEKLRERMAATIERAKAEDPRELRKRIAELERDLRKSRGNEAAPIHRIQIERVEVPLLKREDRDIFDRLAKAFGDAVLAGEKAQASFDDLQARVARMNEKTKIATGAERRPESPPPARSGSPAGVRSKQTPAPSPDSNGKDLPGAQRRVLGALAWLEGVGVPSPDRVRVAHFSELAPGMGYTRSVFGALHTAGLIEYPGYGLVSLTHAGRSKADPGVVPQSAEEMQQQVLARLPKAQREVLAALIEIYPKAISRDAAAEAVSLAPGMGYTRSVFGRLRTLGLIDYPRPGEVVATPVLFLERSR